MNICCCFRFLVPVEIDTAKCGKVVEAVGGDRVFDMETGVVVVAEDDVENDAIHGGKYSGRRSGEVNRLYIVVIIIVHFL